MNCRRFELAGISLAALPSGGLWWEDRRLFCVADLHLGKSERQARRGGALLPPYETVETLSRLDADIARLQPAGVICLGDSFDDTLAAESLTEDNRLWLLRLQAGRDWIWIEGNHDPGRAGPGGRHLGSLALGPLVFRHIAEGATDGEISGHYHPKAVLTGKAGTISRPCFLFDDRRVILPAYGAYTGGLRWTDAAFARILRPGARAILTGATPLEIPAPAGSGRAA